MKQIEKSQRQTANLMRKMTEPAMRMRERSQHLSMATSRKKHDVPTTPQTHLLTQITSPKSITSKQQMRTKGHATIRCFRKRQYDNVRTT